MPRNGFLSFERDADPVDLAADDLVVVVGALRPAEDDRADVVFERLRATRRRTAAGACRAGCRGCAAGCATRPGVESSPCRTIRTGRAHIAEFMHVARSVVQRYHAAKRGNRHASHSYPVDARLQDRGRGTDMPPRSRLALQDSAAASGTMLPARRAAPAGSVRGTIRGTSATKSLLGQARHHHPLAAHQAAIALLGHPLGRYVDQRPCSRRVGDRRRGPEIRSRPGPGTGR